MLTERQAEREFENARRSYEASGSAAARKRLTRALVRYLKAGGRVTFRVESERKSA